MDYIVRQIEYAADSFKSKANHSSNAFVVVTYQEWSRFQKQKEQIFLGLAKKIQNIRDNQGEANIVKRQIHKINQFVDEGRRNQQMHRLSKEIKLNYKRSYQIFEDTLRNIAKNCKCDLQHYRKTMRQKETKKMKEQQRQQRIYEERRRREQQEQEDRRWEEKRWRQEQRSQQDDEDQSWPYLLTRQERQYYRTTQNLTLFSEPPNYKQQQEKQLKKQQEEKKKQQQRKLKQKKQKRERQLERITQFWEDEIEKEEQRQRMQNQRKKKEKRQNERKQKQRKQEELRQKQIKQEELRQKQRKQLTLGVHPQEAQYFQKEYDDLLGPSNNIYGNYVPTYPNTYGLGHQYLVNNGSNVSYQTGGYEVPYPYHAQTGYSVQKGHYVQRLIQLSDGQLVEGLYFIPEQNLVGYQHPQQHLYHAPYHYQGHYNHQQIPHQYHHQIPSNQGFKGMTTQNTNSHSQLSKNTPQSTLNQNYVTGGDGVTLSNKLQKLRQKHQLSKIKNAEKVKNLKQILSKRRQQATQARNKTVQQVQFPMNQPDSCAMCKIVPEDVLTLACDHHLCLNCAAERLNFQMKKCNPAKSIVCQFCYQRTQLPAETISELQKYIPCQRSVGRRN